MKRDAYIKNCVLIKDDAYVNLYGAVNTKGWAIS